MVAMPFVRLAPPLQCSEGRESIMDGLNVKPYSSCVDKNAQALCLEVMVPMGVIMRNVWQGSFRCVL